MFEETKYSEDGTPLVHVPEPRLRGGRVKPRWRLTLLASPDTVDAEGAPRINIVPVPQSLLLNAVNPTAAMSIMAATSRGQRVRAVFNSCPLSRLAVTRDEVHFRVPPESLSSITESGQYVAKLLLQFDEEGWEEHAVELAVRHRRDVLTAVKEGITAGREAYLADCIQKLDLFPFAMEVFLKGFLHLRRMQYAVASSDVDRDTILTQRDPVFSVSIFDVLALRPDLASQYDFPALPAVLHDDPLLDPEAPPPLPAPAPVDVKTSQRTRKRAVVTI